MSPICLEPHRSMPSGFTIHNFELPIDDVLAYFSRYDEMFFFCPKYARTPVEMAMQMTIDDLTNFDPLTVGRDLMGQLVLDIDLYQSKNPHPSLEDSNFLDNMEIICGEIEEYVDFYVRNRLPTNQQCSTIRPSWKGNSLVFGLRIY